MGHLKVTFLLAILTVAFVEIAIQISHSRQRQRFCSGLLFRFVLTRATVTTCACVSIIACDGTLIAQTTQKTLGVAVTEVPKWATGKSLTQILASPTSISWTAAPFKQRVKAFAATKHIAVFIDRRLDPDSKINLRRTGITVEQLLLDVAEELGVGVCRVDDIVYFGPLETAQALPIAWQDLPRMSNRSASLLTWDHLSIPAEILRSLADTAGIRIANIERICHDLWSAGSYPSLNPTQQIALVAVGFDAWPRRDKNRPNTLTLVDWTAPTQGTIRHVRNDTDTVKSRDLRRVLRRKFEGTEFKVTNKSVVMTGTTDAIYAARAFLIRRNTLQTDSKDIRFTMKVAASRLQILTAIANQTRKELVFESSMQVELARRVDFECKGFELPQIVDRVLEGSGFTFTLTPHTITIHEN